MRCPCCNEEMEKGMIESSREVFYSSKQRRGKFFFHGLGGDVCLTEKIGHIHKEKHFVV